MSTLYNVNFYRHDKKINDVKKINANTSKEAVSQVIQASEKHNVKISKISVSVDGSTGLQRFCDVCLLNEASHGIKDKYVCKAHLNAV
jgi:hypothetical protein